MKLNQAKTETLGDYGEDEMKALDNINGKFPSNKEAEDPLDIAKLEAEIKAAALNDIKH